MQAARSTRTKSCALVCIRLSEAQAVAIESGVAFPLTPALSLRERETVRAAGKSRSVSEYSQMAESCSLSLGERVRVRGNAMPNCIESAKTSLLRQPQRQIKPRQANVSPHMADAGAPGRIIEHGEPLSELHDRRQPDAVLRPRAVPLVEHDRLVSRIPVIQVLAPIDPNGIGVFPASVHADVVGKQEPGLVGGLVVKGGVLDLLLGRDDGLGVERPWTIQVPCAGDADGAFGRRRGSGAKEHQVLAAMLDDVARTGGHGVIGPRLATEGRHLRLLCPGTGGRLALRLHRQIGEHRNEIGRGTHVGRAQVEHVPRLAVLEGHAVGSALGVVFTGRAQLQHRALSSPSVPGPCSSPARPANRSAPPRRSSCNRCRRPGIPRCRARPGNRIGPAHPRGAAPRLDRARSAGIPPWDGHPYKAQPPRTI